jgi:hypothetical protein
MNNQQLQTAIDKCMAVMLQNGGSLKQYHTFFYERLSANLLTLLKIQTERAAMYTKPFVTIKND